MAANYARGQSEKYQADNGTDGANQRQIAGASSSLQGQRLAATGSCSQFAFDSSVNLAGARTRPNPNCGQYQRPDEEVKMLDESERATLELLNKNSFTCTLIGARRTGKRTIVKCFVKILNEFKIAADEYKKEQMLSKLVDCSEKLQELTDRRQQELEAADRVGAEPAVQRSRINSWLGGISMNKLMGQNKRRLHSTAGIPLRDKQSHNSDQQQRRHTAIDQIFVSRPSIGGDSAPPPNKEATGGIVSNQNDSMFRFNGHLSPGGLVNAGLSFNRSDSLINYDDTSCNDAESIPMTQLRVPILVERKVSDPGSSRVKKHEERRSTACSTTNLAATNNQQDFSDSRIFIDMESRPQRRSAAFNRTRRRKRKQLVSLKELNKRRCKIRFKTRRQISSCLLVDESQTLGDAASTARQQQVMIQNLPDSFFVIYAINDRHSFEFAGEVIAKLRLIKYEYPIPIVLVANKIDLERAKVVRSEEGRNLAKKFACKFLEISCTVGFNLDNLLVGLRTQLILKHHVTLRSILKIDKSKAAPNEGATGKQPEALSNAKNGSTPKINKESNNILVRFYKRYVVDSNEQDYDCDNFSKI